MNLPEAEAAGEIILKTETIEICPPFRESGGMNVLKSPDKGNGGNGNHKNLDVCSIVIFGASGDLTARKLIPAFYQLFKEKFWLASVKKIRKNFLRAHESKNHHHSQKSRS